MSDLNLLMKDTIERLHKKIPLKLIKELKQEYEKEFLVEPRNFSELLEVLE